jgi:hypothetical protein
MRRGSSTRWVKLYFRHQDKVMRAIPNIEALVLNEVLAKVYTLNLEDGTRKLIYQVEDDE